MLYDSICCRKVKLLKVRALLSAVKAILSLMLQEDGIIDSLMAAIDVQSVIIVDASRGWNYRQRERS